MNSRAELQLTGRAANRALSCFAGSVVVLGACVLLFWFVSSRSSRWLEEPLLRDQTLLVPLVLALLGLAVFLWGAGRQDWDPLQPQRLFYTEWLFVLAISTLRLTSVERPFTARTWLIIGTALLAFRVGSSIGASGKGRYLPFDEVASRCRPKWSMTKAAVFLALAGIVALVIMAIQVVHLGEIPLLASNPEWARNNLAINGVIHRFGLTAYVLIPLAYASAQLNRYRSLFLGLAMVCLLIFAAIAMFYYILNSLFIVAVLYRYSRESIPWRKLIAIGLLLVGAKMGIDALRFSRTEQFGNMVERLGYPRAASSIAPSYVYLAFNLQVFQNVSEMIPGTRPYSYGYYIAYPVRSLWTPRGGGEVGRDRLVDSLWQRGMEWFNLPVVTTTYLGDAYADFGWLGTVAYSFAFGWLAMRAYTMLRSAPSFWRLFIYAHICFAIFYSFMGAYFDLFDVYWAVLVTAGFCWCAKASPRRVRVSSQLSPVAS